MQKKLSEDMKKSIIYTGNFNIIDMNAAGKRVWGNVQILKKLGYNVILICMPSNKDNGNQSTNIVVFQGVKVYTYSLNLCKKNRWRVFSFFREFKKIVGNILNENDVSHIIMYSTPTLALMNSFIIRYAKKKNMAVIADVVDWLTPNSDSIFFNLFKKFEAYYENVVVALRCDGIIAISDWLKDYYEKRNKKVVVIPPIAETEDVDFVANSQAKIVYAGVPFRSGVKITNYAQMKDRIDLIIELLLKVKRNGGRFELNIIGVTQKELLDSLPKLENSVQELGESIIFHGKKTIEYVKRVLINADFSILIRDDIRATRAGFPTKVSESIGCGTPVITNKTSNIIKYLSEDNSVIYINDISDETIDKVTCAVNDSTIVRGERKDFCRNNNPFSEEKFEWDMKKFIENIYV